MCGRLAATALSGGRGGSFRLDVVVVALSE